MANDDLSVQNLLEQSDALKDQKRLAAQAQSIFEFTNFLLDDDDNLTKTGNLKGEAKARLRARALELLGHEEGSASHAEKINDSLIEAS